MLVKDNFYITFKNNYNKIKVILDLYSAYRHGTGVFNLELINENFVNITYLDKNDISLKIEKNKSDISSNLIKINSNEDDILYNLSEINYLKNNKSTQYLKNIYNILFYDKTTQIDFRNLIYFMKKYLTLMLIKIILLKCILKSIYNMKIYQKEIMLKLYMKYLMTMIIVYI